MAQSFYSEFIKAARLDAAALLRMAADRLYKFANDVSWPAGYMEAPSPNVSHEWVPISVHFTRPTSWKSGSLPNEKEDVFYVDTDSSISVRDPIGKDAPSEDVESGVSAGAQYDLHLAKAADANAANDLRALMSRISEDVWSASWLMGLEFRLWRDIIAAESDDDERGIFYHDRETILTLAKKAGGWWLWDEELFCERFVPLTEWNAIYAEHERKASV